MNDDFEKRLQQVAPREISPAWREEILTAAQLATASHSSPPVAHRPSWWRELFWPCPQAWGALAAVWLVILGGRFIANEASPKNLTQQTTQPSPQTRELLRQQGQMFAELVGLIEKPEPGGPKAITPHPRSQRREKFLNT